MTTQTNPDELSQPKDRDVGDQSVVSRPVRYVLGFAFTDDADRVLMVEKRRGPKLNFGRLNGVGGKVEDDESYADAMSREFREEAKSEVRQWDRIGSFTGPSWEIEIFKGVILSEEVPAANDVGEPLRFEDVVAVCDPCNSHWYAQNVQTMVAHARSGEGLIQIWFD